MTLTIDLPESVLREAKRLARERGIPFRDLVAEGLRLFLKEEKSKGTFRLVDASFHGDGLAAGRSEADWECIRDLAYECSG